MKVKVEKPGPGLATITVTYESGRIQTCPVTDATKADAMTGALSAAGKLGVDIDMPEPRGA